MLINSKTLLDKLSFVAQGCQSKGAYPECHKYVLLELSDVGLGQVLTLRSFDGQTHFKVKLGQIEAKTVRSKYEQSPEDEEGSFGPFVFDPSRILSGLKKAKDQIRITIDFEKKILLLTMKGTKIKEAGYSGFAFAEYKNPQEARRVPVPERLAQAIDNSIWAVNPKHHQTALQGIMMRVVESEEEPIIEVCGTDKTMFSYVQDTDNSICFEQSAIVSMAACKAISSMLKLFDAPHFLLAHDRAYCTGGDYEILSILVNEPMIAFWSIIEMLKASEFLSCRIDLDRLQDALALARIYEDEYGSILVKFDKEMKLLGFNPQTGRKAESSLQFVPINGAKFDGASFCVNATYLEKLVKSTNSTSAEMLLAQGEEIKLVYFKPTDSNSLRVDMFLSLMAMQPHYEGL